MLREIQYFIGKSGRCYIKEYIDKLTLNQKKKVAFVFLQVASQNIVPTKFLKKLKNANGLWEIRVEYGGNTFRFLGFFEENNLIILNHAFTKKSQKIPKNEINIAKIRREEYNEKKSL